MDMQGGECSGDGENADTQPDVPLLIYVGLRTPGVPQSRNAGSPAHTLTECARRHTQFGPIPRPPGRAKPPGDSEIYPKAADLSQVHSWGSDRGDTNFAEYPFPDVGCIR